LKQLVNLIQLIIVAAIILPVLSMVDNDIVENFCQKIEPGMSKQAYLEIVEQEHVKLAELFGGEVAGAKWKSVAVPRLPFADLACVTEGVSNIVATTELVDTFVESASQ
jgi:hypothetical protein